MANPSWDCRGLGFNGALHGADHLQVPEGWAWGPLLPPGKSRKNPGSRWWFSKFCSLLEGSLAKPLIEKVTFGVSGIKICAVWHVCVLVFRQSLLWTRRKTESTQQRLCSSPSTCRGSTLLCRWDLLGQLWQGKLEKHSVDFLFLQVIAACRSFLVVRPILSNLISQEHSEQKSLWQIKQIIILILV